MLLHPKSREQEGHNRNRIGDGLIKKLIDIKLKEKKTEVEKIKAIFEMLTTKISF